MASYFSRRTLLASSVIAAITQISSKAAANEGTKHPHIREVDVSPKTVSYEYEVNYTEAEWKNRLTEKEFNILRESGTERKKSSPLWKEKRTGAYKCKGCDLDVYDSEYKVILRKGWAFFQHSEPDSVLTGIDLYTNYGSSKKVTSMEVHCRRCGSHFGHILYVKGQILHCINGTSLTFTPSA